jgi:hypothetical protein
MASKPATGAKKSSTSKLTQKTLSAVKPLSKKFPPSPC